LNGLQICSILKSHPLLLCKGVIHAVIIYNNGQFNEPCRMLRSMYDPLNVIEFLTIHTDFSLVQSTAQLAFKLFKLLTQSALILMRFTFLYNSLFVLLPNIFLSLRLGLYIIITTSNKQFVEYGIDTKINN